MSYDLSFDKRQAALLLLCFGIIAALLMAAGFLLGLRHAEFPTAASAAPMALAVPATPAAKLLSRSEPPVAAPSGTKKPGTATQPGTAMAPVPAAVPGTSEPPSTPSLGSGFTLQYGAYEDKAHAENQVKNLKQAGIIATILTAQDRAGRTWYAVRSGSFATMPLASEAAETVRATSGAAVLIRPVREL